MATVIPDSDQFTEEEFPFVSIEDSETDSDDSQEDPTFDALESARSSFSRLSIKKKKPKSCSSSNLVEDDNEEEVVVPELNAEDQKSYEAVEKIIQGGQVEKLKVDQCKVYLRKHGLRLTGNKDILIGRIKEHIDILKCGGERKYPASSFVLNCKGDACTGDVVMFEQNVYEMFNIASRSATGPACGKRVVAGRIVKESYGAAKQQHTFTIEVLWSRGEKPLYPLYPLLIKGRNLYRLQTMRQRWEDEQERRRILSEKHARGSLARSDREVRIQDKEMRKKLKANRGSTMQHTINQKETNREPIKSTCVAAEKLVRQPREQQKKFRENVENFNPKYLPSEITHQRQHSTSIFKNQNQGQFVKPISSMDYERRRNHDRSRSPLRRPLGNINNAVNVQIPNPYLYQPHTGPLSQPGGYYHGLNQNQGRFMKPISSLGVEQKINHDHSRIPLIRPLGNMKNAFNMETRDPFLLQPHANPLHCVQPRKSNQIHGQAQRQYCRFYAQGRCYYGDNCKYLHDVGETQNHGKQDGGRRLPSVLGAYR